MGFWQKLFRRDMDNWSTAGISTANALGELASGNPVVDAELKEFLRAVQAKDVDITNAARNSARALSGYGIAVSAHAFLAYLEEIRLRAG